MVNEEAIRFPALTAELVILAKAVTPITCNAENLVLTASTAFPRIGILVCLDAALISSKPLEAPDKFNFCLSLSRVDIVVETLRSK